MEKIIVLEEFSEKSRPLLEEIALLSCELNSCLQKFDSGRKIPSRELALKSLKSGLEKNRGKVYCFLEGKKPAGFVSVFPEKKPEGFRLDEVVVGEKFRGKGIGSKIFRKIIKDFGGKKLLVAPLQANERAINFYKKFGFSESELKRENRVVLVRKG